MARRGGDEPNLGVEMLRRRSPLAGELSARGRGRRTEYARLFADQDGQAKSGFASNRYSLGTLPSRSRAALPHEMTHVVLADAFAGDELPRWADEGMAMLADPAETLAGHSRDLNAAIAEHREFRVGELFVKSYYPTGTQRDVFYGESASLVAFLASQRPPAQLVDFFHRASRRL